MAIDPLSAPSPTTTPTLPTTTAASGGMNGSRGEFLKLFVAQLQYQNPLDPMSGADMVAQLATFSDLEQSVETNKQLAALAGEQAAAATAGLAAVVGRVGTADASSLDLDGPPPPLTIHCGGPYASGEVVVRDGNGEPVRTLTLGPGQDGASLGWDGKDAAGRELAPGTYTVEVTLTGRDGAAVAGSPQLTGVIDRIELTAAGPRLGIGGARVSPAAVSTIAQASPSLPPIIPPRPTQTSPTTPTDPLALPTAS
jgi:flagellar basal-body rod modification protein FlgD